MFSIDSVIDRTLIYFPVFRILTDSIHFVEDNGMETACTNGNTIYYNSSFFESLSKDEQASIIAHELMHITLKHLSRLGDRDIEIWNYATDAVINQILKSNGLPLVDGVIDCPDALAYSAEEYYEIIKNRPDCEELMSAYRQRREESKVTTHEHWNEEMEDEITEGLPEIDEHNIGEVNKRLIHEDNEAFKSVSQSQGSATTSLGKVGEETPVIDWKSFLRRKKKKVFSADYDLHHGEFDEEGIYKYPYELIHKSNVEILIDTSGSVDDELVKSFLKECKNIFDEYEIKVGCFDTKFYGFQDIKKKEDLDNFVIEGRGLTDFTVAANAFDRKAPIKIIFTDGYADMPKESKDIIWVVYGDTKINPPGGTVFNVDPESLTLRGKSK